MKKKSKKPRQLNSEMVLQITSMADIFTILLVFLLKSFSTGVSTISPSSNMTLPESKKTNPIVETLKLEVSSSSIMMEDKQILQLNDFQITPTEFESNGSLRSLNAALSQQISKDTLLKTHQILILADQNTPYSTLKKVLASAATNGFLDYKLVVVEDQ